MAEAPLPPPAGQDPGPDSLKTIEAYKQAPIRVGCFGFMFSGWRLLTLIVVAAILVYAASHLGP